MTVTRRTPGPLINVEIFIIIYLILGRVSREQTGAGRHNVRIVPRCTHLHTSKERERERERERWRLSPIGASLSNLQTWIWLVWEKVRFLPQTAREQVKSSPRCPGLFFLPFFFLFFLNTSTPREQNQKVRRQRRGGEAELLFCFHFVCLCACVCVCVCWTLWGWNN